MAQSSKNDFPWHLGVFDAHCHPTDNLTSLQEIQSMHAKVLTIMATRAQDQELVAKAADDLGLPEAEAAQEEMDWSKQHKVIPAFGWHPWFSYQMYDESEHDYASSLNEEQKIAHYRSVLTPNSDDQNFLRSLPEPLPFGHFLVQTRKHLEQYPLALVGEVGLDRGFRLPIPQELENRDEGLTPGGREGRKLSPYKVSMKHQKKILLAQLALAGEMQRAVSCHGVQAHGLVYETLAQAWKGHEKKVLSKREQKKAEGHAEPEAEEAKEKPSGRRPYPPRICLHSFSGPAETVKQYIAPSVPCEIFFSFSTTINAWANDGNGKVEAAVKSVPDDRILIESDLHTAGARMDQYLEEGVRKICQVKGWELEHGVRILGLNWRKFALGRE